MIRVLSIFILFLNISYSTEIPDSDLLKVTEKRCLKEIIKHPLTFKAYPDLLNSEVQSIESFKVLKDMESFCRCRVQGREQEVLKYYKDRIAWSFRDKDEELGKEDQCALSKFNDTSLKLFYHIVVSTRFKNQLQNSLEERRLRGVRRFVSGRSIASQEDCVSTKILKKCTRVKSLQTTYQCIRNTTSSLELIEIMNKCPSLVPFDKEINFSEQLI